MVFSSPPAGSPRAPPPPAPSRAHGRPAPGGSPVPRIPIERPRRPAIGLLGGTFNPPHAGHLLAATSARRAFRLDRVILIPAGHPAHKPAAGLAPARDRLRMVRLLIRGQRGLSVADLEVRRRGPSYTFDTVRAMRRRYPRHDLYWIVGADAVREIPTWHRWRELVRLIPFIVVARPGYPLRRLHGFADRFHLLRMTGSAAAASRLRRTLREGFSHARLPRRVAAYVRRHRLYTAVPEARA